jgi:predicted lactoylglutathione lyase
MLTTARYGTRDLERARMFYDAIGEIIGAKRVMDHDSMSMYRGASGGAFIIGKPYAGDATVGNGAQIGFDAPSRAAVDAAHAKALELGGKCEGPPGPRGPAEMNFYAAYFREHDGTKLIVTRAGPD